MSASYEKKNPPTEAAVTGNRRVFTVVTRSLPRQRPDHSRRDRDPRVGTTAVTTERRCVGIAPTAGRVGGADSVGRVCVRREKKRRFIYSFSPYPFFCASSTTRRRWFIFGVARAERSRLFRACTQHGDKTCNDECKYHTRETKKTRRKKNK